MNKLRATICFLVPLCAAPLWLHAADDEEPLIVEPQGSGEFDYNPDTGVATAQNGVTVRYAGGILTAAKVTINQLTGEVMAEGNVRIEQDKKIWTGERLRYNFKTKEISTESFRTGYAPFFLSGEGLSTVTTNESYTLTNAVVTTDDYANPGYVIRARKIKVVPGKYIQPTGATLWWGKVPIFYFPYMRRSLEGHPNFWTLTPGYRSKFGPFLLAAYHYNWSKELHTALNLDYRLKRGPGIGPDADWDHPVLGQGSVRYYYTHDEAPGTSDLGEPIPANRQRVWYAHKATLRTNLTARAMVRYWSDPLITHDFYEAEYRQNVQPNSFFELNQDWQNWNLNVFAQPQVNNFQETVERLPDVKLTGLRQEIGQSPFYYESETSAGYYRRVWPDVHTNTFYPFRPPAYEAARADTYHQLLAPMTFFGWLNVAPRVGGRYTYYSEASGPGGVTDNQSRTVFNTGAEMSLKASRVYRNAKSSLLDVHGLRHIVQPSVNYTYVPTPDVRPWELPQFDTVLNSYRLLPIEFPDYNSIDAIDAQNVLRFGLRNKLQTKRDGQIDTFLNWALYTDWRLNPFTNQTTFAPFYSDLDLKLRSWLILTSQARYDLHDSQLLDSIHMLTIHPPGSDFGVFLGHRFRTREELGKDDLGNNLLLASLAYRLNENWSIRTLQQIEMRDGRWEEQLYTISRDMRSWTLAVSFRIRDSRSGSDDIGVVVTFSLKAFPRYKAIDERERQYLLLGG